jgi:anaerobic selenocysteine-containing dehydrogenase
VALLNAMIHAIIDEGLVNEAFRPRPHQRLRGARREREGILA